MTENIPSRYLPRYSDNASLPDPVNIPLFITNFYRVSDNPEQNEQWVGSFTEDATVQIGPEKAQGTRGKNKPTSHTRYTLPQCRYPP